MGGEGQESRCRPLAGQRTEINHRNFLTKEMTIKGKKILITGGLGFIGFNAVKYFRVDNRVHVVDDMSRAAYEENLRYLREWGVGFSRVDISHRQELRKAYQDFQPDVVIHLAAQVAVTLSVTNPMRDFMSNVCGTMNLLELARRGAPKPVFLYASTNKVYRVEDGRAEVLQGRYVIPGFTGYDEAASLSFSTPYGCSKGAADQYVLDYCRTYGVPAVVFRQSCVYGPHQYGIEDQGWVAWFAVCALLGKPVTVYGDGCQVRDVLYVDDLLDIYARAIERIDEVKGEAFNVGGGAERTLAVNELLEMLRRKIGSTVTAGHQDHRPGDQKVFISDIGKARRMLGWQPRVSVEEGVTRMLGWIAQARKEIEHILASQDYVGKRCDVSIVIPARNEEACLPAVLDEVEGLLAESVYRYEVIVVNDRSTDGTRAIAERYPFVRLADNRYGPGKGAALRTGFELARGTYIAMMDADFSHYALDLPLLVDEARRHQGLVVASRITGGSGEYTRVRAFGNIVLTWLFGFVHGRYLSDALNGFKVFHRDVFEKYAYTSDSFDIEVELLVNTLRLGKSITEVPSRERARLAGEVKSSVIRHGALFAMRILSEKFRKPDVRRD